MIKYKLLCKNCSNSFDSWFASSKEYEKLKKLKYLNCCHCNSFKVEKTLMAPNILSSKSKNLPLLKNKKINEIKNKIKKYQKFIKKNFNYVGENFAYEARSLHYNDKKKSKGIYGKASNDDILELKEEGIETEIIPWFRDKNN
ncbi:DUF1178 family protein [Candidatus Pelagibacter sp.]|nr:DUF1178 family protein [Candidatus Pelagibacter sp.]